MIALTPHLDCKFLEEKDIHLGNLKKHVLSDWDRHERRGSCLKSSKAGLPATERSKNVNHVQSQFRA